VAVKDLTLEIEPGEFLFLLGPSGAGKTTVLRLIGGYEQPSSGAIWLGDQDVTSLAVHQRNIGMVFQNYALFPHMTVAQNVAFGLKMRRLPKKELAQQVAQALELVQLTGLEKRYPRQLSGGQQQRVALARAIVYCPALLLLDEPLANLDRRLRDTMRLELKQLQRRIGITTIMVTHDQEESLSMADRVAVLHQGSLEQAGPPAEVYNRPATPFVAAFIGELNMLRGELLAVEGESLGRVQAGGIEFTVRLDEAMRARWESNQVKAEVDQVRPGSPLPITVCLRAERLAVKVGGQVTDQKPEAGLNSFAANVEVVTYLGAATLYLVKPEGATVLLKVLEPNAAGQPLHRAGDQVLLCWSPESAVSFLEG
jgi:spermidine/putrescine ABC transporter ATP-binding subunit